MARASPTTGAGSLFPDGQLPSQHWNSTGESIPLIGPGTTCLRSGALVTDVEIKNRMEHGS